MNETHEQNSHFWFGFFIGGIVGSIVLFLLGTREGKKLLERIEEKLEFLEEDLEQKLEEAQGKGDRFLKKAKSIHRKISHDLNKNKKELANKITESVDQTQEFVGDLQKQVEIKAHHINHRFFKKNGKILSA